jgi:putative radical SAM enzyme (TIGR03279 family)
MIEILDIEEGSIAEELGIRPGNKLVSINGETISDMLDYRFHNTGEEVEVGVEMDGELVIFDIEKDYQEDLGIVLEDLKMRKCGNKCVFCFVHQNPKGLRKTLYFKDEDYRFSFLYGHYVTLSNARQQDLDRIVRQRLTPLYISVHATEPEMRKYLLGIKFDDQLMQKIEYLTGNGIELNTQIVLCPGLNDGMQLDRTLTDLKAYFPGIRSVAIVPVGLTKHRRNLPELQPVTDDYSLNLMDFIDQIRTSLKKELGSSFVYLSDEFYIRTGRQIPAANYYEEFYQLENGVGLSRNLIDNYRAELPHLRKMAPSVNLTLLSGKLGAAVLRRYIMPELRTIPHLKVKLYQATNYFYGSSIVVAGLLVGRDIYNQLKNKELGDYIVLPPRILNHDNLFLDGWTVRELEEKLGRKIFIFPDSFTVLFEKIRVVSQVDSEAEAQRIRHSGPSLYVAEQVKSNEALFAKALNIEQRNRDKEVGEE